MGGQIDIDRHVIFIILLCYYIYHYFLNTMVIVTTTSLVRWFLNSKQPFHNYFSELTSEPKVTWESVFWSKLSLL